MTLNDWFIVLGIPLFLLAAVSSMLYASYRSNLSKLISSNIQHDRCQLAIQRIAYIRDLRFALRQCRSRLNPLWDNSELSTLIDELTTAVDSNGQPLKKGNNELY